MAKYNDKPLTTWDALPDNARFIVSDESQTAGSKDRNLTKAEIEEGVLAAANIAKGNKVSGDPTPTDDATKGYAVGSRWLNTDTDSEFVCLDASEGAAIWVSTTSALSSLGELTDVDFETVAPTDGQTIKFDIQQGLWLPADDLQGVSSGGEANTASNVGTSGVGLFKEKSGVELRFKKLAAGNNVSLSEANDVVTIEAAGGGAGAPRLAAKPATLLAPTWTGSIVTSSYEGIENRATFSVAKTFTGVYLSTITNQPAGTLHYLLRKNGVLVEEADFSYLVTGTDVFFAAPISVSANDTLTLVLTNPSGSIVWDRQTVNTYPTGISLWETKRTSSANFATNLGSNYLSFAEGGLPKEVVGPADPADLRVPLGTTTNRPSTSALLPGQTLHYFDSDLGKPIWWSGAGWVDATGASV